jgi:ribosomal protein S18 acetylase RimI-like enzyme
MTLHREAWRGDLQAPPGVRVRCLSGKDDLRAVAHLYGTAFGDSPWSPTWTEFPGFDPEGVFLAQADDELVAFVVSYVRPNAPDQGYISVVATLPSHRRRGIAAALVHCALDRFWRLGYTAVSLDVRADNVPAQRLYESAGFRHVGEFVADEHCRRMPDPQLPAV